MSQHAIRVAVADDHEVIRIGLERVISVFDGMSVVAQFPDANDVLRADLTEVDVLILDMNMPGAAGMPLIGTLISRYPALKIIVFSMLPEESFAPRALAAGAAAFLNKNRPPEEVIAAIQAVQEHGRFLPGNQQDLLQTMGGDTDVSLHKGLSAREFEILLLIAKGQKPTDIGRQLELKIGTVTTHVHRIKRKLGVKSLGDLVVYAHRHGLLGS